MKIKTFIFPKFKDWFKDARYPRRQEIGKYICLISIHELFGKKYYSIEISYRAYPCYVDTVYNDAIRVTKTEKQIKRWYKKSVKKANKAWKKEMKPFFVKE